MAVKKEKIVEKKLYCTSCGKEKLPRYFYKSNHLKDVSGYHQIACKECAKQKIYSENGQINKQAVKKLLNEMDLPFYNKLYLSVLEEEKEFFGTYCARLNTFNNSKISKGTIACWEDGEGFEDVKPKQNNIKDIETDLDEDELLKLRKFWGKGYDPEQYEELQNFYDDFVTNYECDSPAQVLNFKNASKTQLQADNALENSNVDMYNKLIKTLSTILGDSNVKPVQSTGAEANDQITFGVLIKKYENEKPIPLAIDDEMKRYIDTYMVGHLAKMEGLNNDLVDKYNEAIKEYTVDFDEENTEDDE